MPLVDVDPITAVGRSTGVPELDRVLGGGLVQGSATLLGGEPGIGKSTLLLQALGRMAAAGASCLLVCGEESKEQVRLRAERLQTLDRNLLIVTETSLPAVLDRIIETCPDVVAVDSIQTMFDPEVGGAPGSVGQVRECAHRLVRAAKERSMATVLAFEGDRHHSLRMLHALKHRFGTTNELGVFEMNETGMSEVEDPSSLFLADRRPGLPGSVVTATMEGVRPLLVEVQALVAFTSAPAARRSARGLDSARLDLILAVLQSRAGRPLGGSDVYASVAGGLKVHDPGADVAIAVAVTSALTGVSLPEGLVAIGELGLGGELRQAAQTVRRLEEAARLGFRTAIVPASTPNVDGIRLQRAEHIGTVLDSLRLV